MALKNPRKPLKIFRRPPSGGAIGSGELPHKMHAPLTNAGKGNEGRGRRIKEEGEGRKEEERKQGREVNRGY